MVFPTPSSAYHRSMSFIESTMCIKYVSPSALQVVTIPLASITMNGLFL